MRYDENEERKSQLMKIAATAVGVTVGAKLLKDNGELRHISKAFGDISQTVRRVKEDVDLVGRKGLTADGISSLYKKHYKNDDSTWNVLKTKETFEVNLKESGLFKDLNKINNIEKTFQDINVKRRDRAVRDYAMKKLEDILPEAKIRDDDFIRNLNSVVDDMTRRRSTYFDMNKNGTHILNENAIDKVLDKSLVKEYKDEVADVVKEALDNSSEIMKNLEDVSEESKNQVVDLYKEHLKDKYRGVAQEGGERAATVQDILDAVKEKRIDQTEDVIEWSKEVEKMIEQDSSFGDLVVDKFSYRMDAENNFYTTKNLKDAGKEMAEDFSETIAGKLFGVKNFIEHNNSPDLLFFSKGSYDPGLAKLQGGKDLTTTDLMYVGNKFYSFGKDGLKHFEEGDNRTLISGRQGNLFGFMDRIAGNTSYKEQNNTILKALDINTKGGDAFESMLTIVSKYNKNNDSDEIRNWSRNLTMRIVGEPKSVNEFYDDIKELSIQYNRNTKQASRKTINELRKVGNEKANQIFDIMMSDNPISQIVSENPSFINSDLNTLIKRVHNNPDIKDTMTRKGGNNSIIKFDEILNRELLKEAIFRQIGDLNKGQGLAGYTNFMSKLEKSGATEIEKVNVRDIMNWGIIQSKAGLFTNELNRPKTLSQKVKGFESLQRMIHGTAVKSHEDVYLEEFKDSILRFGQNMTSPTNKIDINKNDITGHFREQWMTVNKTVSPLDIIKSINNETKSSTNNEINNFVRQLVAGRNNIEEVSNLTMLPYHLVNRLTTPLESLGLGFSNASTGSTLDLVKNIGLKRILPIAGAAFALSYLNYESENITGTSLTESYQNAKANFGVGIRTLLTPFDGYLERQREFNPIANYWLGDHKDKEEYLDYLEYGYDPVRKGRFWSFGSASEFRGGKISYWEPNKLRQAHSNYRDIAIYGSSEEKWKHSIIPTLRHPFSTLRYLSNPYWLEEKHYDDRPYPVSGKMFSEGTPWGAILNPTIGQAIKPMKKMHQEHLQGTAYDVRSIIRNRNLEVKERAAENSLVRIDESGVTPMSFAPASMPSMSEAVYNIKVQDGKITQHGFEGQDHAEGYDNIESVQQAKGPSGPSVNTIAAIQAVNKNANIDNANVLNMLAKLSTSRAFDGDQTLDMINRINSGIKNKQQPGQSFQNGQWIEKANLHTTPFKKKSFGAKLDYMNDMIAFDTKKDFVHDMMYSGKQLSGMYGFLLDQVIPASHGYKWQQAGKMSSFSRKFWDESVGGLGGNFMEIARRFFPHDDHNITQVNPIQNTMPDWMPERFQTGDPYTKLPNGEARLPGAGFEALNKLHPDQYGAYGAFDRYKILSDIAPLSEEYKIWKKIAKEEVSHPFLKKEMANIEQRVKEQIKEHDFYDYKFLGRRMTTVQATVSEVSNTGKFKIIGNEQEFSIAGLKMLKDEEGKSQVHNYLQAGMNVALRFENNNYRNKDSEGNIAAIVSADGRNLNEEMWKRNAAKKKETLDTLADQTFMLSDFNNITGHVWEAIGHAPIPFIHNKFLRINSPLETYKKEQVYGTPYSTWDHPIKGFVKPAFQEAMASNPWHHALGIGVWAASEFFKDTDNRTMKAITNTAFAFTTPGAFAGGMIGAIPKMSFKDTGDWNARNGARIGAAVTLAGYALNNTTNPYLSAVNFGVLGTMAQAQLKFAGVSKAQAGLVGAAIGVGLSGLNPNTELKDFIKPKSWIPKDTKKKWELEEYFDRLEYIKYNNLYSKAARKAKRKEGVDVKRIINIYERNKEKNEKLIAELENQKEQTKNMIDEQAAKELSDAIDQQIYDLLTPVQYFGAGEYTKAALAYKKAADTTIYGLTEDSSTADVLRALPKYDRDFFLEFANEKDPKAREKILKSVSPYKQKALKILWEEEYDKQKSNRSFFSGHALPGLFWSGWKPQVDLDNVKMKTIENEGMLLSDFGMYESSKNEPAYKAAPEIRDINNSNGVIRIQAQLTTLLNGVGFIGSDVTVQPSMSSGIQVFSNIVRETSYVASGYVRGALEKLIL